ncbi:FtsX-like permease family protein [Actinomycetaceae bacterium MB13-C1-2]|nr:FtsX-like permease family protein [Actinomycetaceae bacterium MB13-C1-2]
MRNAIKLAPRLAVERLRSHQGSAILDVFAVIAFTVATLLALTVSGGTWVFVNWHIHGNPEMMANFGDAATMVDQQFTSFYVVLAVIACALVVVPILSLGGAAARLGARGRSSRLASLRLVGMTGSEVVAMSVVETTFQALVGMVFGTLAWLASLPLWSLVSFQTVHLNPTDMRGPWWLWLAVWGIMLILAVSSTIIGLRRVRISPLGVANRQTPPAMKSWRFWVFVLAVVVATVLVTNGNAMAQGIVMGVLVIGGLITVLMLVINLMGPWLIQMIARIRAKTNSVPTLLASRRVADDPKAAWRNVSALSLIGFIAAFTLMMPTNDMAAEDDVVYRTMLVDLRTGVLITVGIGLVVAAVSTLISQSSSVIDRADEERSMDRMGIPRSVFSKMRRRQVLLPLLVTLAISIGLGLLMASPFMSMVSPSSPMMLAGVAIAGIALSLLAAEACRPVLNTVLGQTKRRND